MSFWQFLQDLFNPTLAFLPKALIVAILSAILCGVVGVHVVIRGMSFVGDALAHAVFPGIAIAFALQSSIFLGGAVAGITVAILIALFRQTGKVKDDALIGVFFSASFALGLVIMSRIPGYTGSLESFLFGSLTGVTNTEISLVGGGVLLLLSCLWIFHKEIVAVSLDRDVAKALRLPVTLLDMLLYVVVAGAVVVSVRTIGNVLVLAILVIPPATCRLLTNKLSVMLILSPFLGSVGAIFGIYASWSFGAPTGACIVLVLASFFILAWIGSSLSNLYQYVTSTKTR